jgi:branched-chain amino acid transport system substrate-binding protein
VKRRETLKQTIIVSLVAALAIIMITGCMPAAAPTPTGNVITAKIGFLAPLTGPTAGWGLPGLYGDQIWCDHLNAQGGIELSDGTHVMVEMVPYDDEYITEKAVTGGKKLVLEDGVVLVQMLGGADAAAIVPWFTDQMMLSTTLLPSDLTPATLYHLAPLEVCPFYNAGHIEWLAEHLHEFRPDLTADGVITFAQVAQDDELGRPGMATMNAAAEAAGMKIVYWELFDPETTDFAPIVSEAIASGADILDWGISYPDYVNLLTVQAYEQGYKGQLASCTLDFYEAIMEKTGPEFLENFVWQFPRLDDPKLNPNPNPYALMKNADFYNEYVEKYPGTWSAVSYEYMAQLDEWMQAVKAADSIDPMLVFSAWKHPEENNIYHIFGRPAEWWGKPFWGIDNAFMAPWPVVRMVNSKPQIEEFRDQLDWWNRNKEYMVKWNMNLGEMWWQRMGVDMRSGMKLWGVEDDYSWLLSMSDQEIADWLASGQH